MPTLFELNVSPLKLIVSLESPAYTKSPETALPSKVTSWTPMFAPSPCGE